MSSSELLPPKVLEKEGEPSPRVRGLLESARRYLGMDLAFLGQFVDGHEIYRTLAGDGTSFGLSEGSAVPLADTYCLAMVDGRIDNVVADSAAEPAVAGLAVTAAGRIGRYMGVPVRLPDGRLYGALCGLGHDADPTLRRRDANLLDFLAELVAGELEREEQESKRRRELDAAVRALLDGSRFTMVFQPIFELRGGTVAGFEALARFCAHPARSPDAWFDDAAEVGLDTELEMMTLGAGLAALERLPESAYLSVNASAETVCSTEFADALAGVDLARVMLEITEHAAVANYDALAGALRPLRSEGLRLAVDDAGAGTASLHYIVELAPELIKMDISLTRGIDSSPARSAMATALVSFGAATGASILAEGIETEAELAAVAGLGVGYGQGYLLGRPAPLGELRPAVPRPSTGRRRLMPRNRRRPVRR